MYQINLKFRKMFYTYIKNVLTKLLKVYDLKYNLHSAYHKQVLQFIYIIN
jgi:hypothetical protein